MWSRVGWSSARTPDTSDSATDGSDDQGLAGSTATHSCTQCTQYTGVNAWHKLHWLGRLPLGGVCKGGPALTALFRD